jgi:hypothetical protein
VKRPAAPHSVVVATWLNDLAVLTAGNRPAEDLKVKVAALTGVVADAFPDPAVFTKASLYAISQQTTFLPSFAELHRLLTDWWQSNQPRMFFVPLELENASMSAEDRANVIVWLQHETAKDLSRREMTARLAVIRRYAPAGYRWVIANNLLAADIAVTHRWAEAEHRWAPPSEEEKAAVARLVRPYTAPVVSASAAPRPQQGQGGAYGPAAGESPTDPANAASDAARAEAAARFEATHGRKPGALAPDVLDAMRAQAGIKPAPPPAAPTPGPAQGRDPEPARESADSESAAESRGHGSFPWSEPYEDDAS